MRKNLRELICLSIALPSCGVVGDQAGRTKVERDVHGAVSQTHESPVTRTHGVAKGTGMPTGHENVASVPGADKPYVRPEDALPDGTVVSPPVTLKCEAGAQDVVKRPSVARLTGAQYRATLKAAFPTVDKPEVPFDEQDIGDVFSNESRFLGLSEMYSDRVILASESNAKLFVPVLKSKHACLASGKWDSACALPVVEALALGLYRRPLESDEKAKYDETIRALVRSGSADVALEILVAAMLQSPNFLFKTQFGVARDADHNQLSPFELAQALSYTLLDAPPDAPLMAAAGDGTLRQPAVFDAHFERLWNAHAIKGGAFRFLKEYLDYDKISNASRDGKKLGFEGFGKSHLTAVEAGTDLWIQSILSDKQEHLGRLLTGGDAFLNKTSAQLYGLSSPAGSAYERVSVPANPGRPGFFMQPAFAIRNAHAYETNPVRRGKFIRERFLCQELPPPPPNIPDLGESNDQAKTMRERLEVHTKDAACASCHRLMDPLGLAFENLDPLGRYVTSDQGRPVDASGRLEGAGSADGPFQGGQGLVARLAKSEVVLACVSKHAMDYALATTHDMKADVCEIANAGKRFAAADGNFKELFRAVFSDAIFNRTVAKIKVE